MSSSRQKTHARVITCHQLSPVAERVQINPNPLYRWKGEFLEELEGSAKEMATEIESRRSQ